MSDERSAEQAQDRSQGEHIPDAHKEVIDLVKFLFFRVESRINEITAGNKESTSSEVKYRAKIFLWSRINIIGALVLSGLTLIVLTATLYSVRKYTTIANESLEADTRPYIKLIPRSQVFVAQADKPLEMPIELDNTGKTPAIGYVHAEIEYSRTKLSNVEFSKKAIHKLIWGEDNAIVSATSVQPISQGEVTDIKAGSGWVYVASDIRYRTHITRICWEYPLGAAGGLGEPKLCNGPRSNCTDEDCH